MKCLIMKKFIAFILLFGLLIGFLMVNTFGDNTSNSKTIEDIVSNMTLDEKITQKIMPAFRYWQESNETEMKNVTSIRSDLEEYLKKYKFCGVDLYYMNTQNIEDTTRLTYQLQQIAINSSVGIPMLIYTDQEGGSVARVGGATITPGNMALGATQNINDVKQVGKIIGEELNALGINTNGAPVLDVNNNPNNPIIGRRSFSSNSLLVSKLGRAYCEGLHQGGVLSTGKHFPGHGDTDTDSHADVPVINKTLDELKQVELYPFYSNLDDLDCIMTAHIAVPKVDNSTGGINNKTISATMSHVIISDILRDQLGYTGVTISDALEMKAITLNFNESDALIRTFAAGVDIALQPFAVYSIKNESEAQSIIDDVKEAIQNHQYDLNESLINESVIRILKLKQKKGLLNLSQYQAPINDKVENTKKIVGSDKHHEVERGVADDSMTLIKNENQLPWSRYDNEKTLFLSQSESAESGFEFGVERLKSDGFLPRNYSYDVDYYSQYRNNSFSDIEVLLNEQTEFWREKLKNYDNVVVLTSIGSSSQNTLNSWETYIPKTILKVANEENKKVIIYSSGLPYDVANYPESKVIIAGYGSRGIDTTDPTAKFSYGPNIPALIDIIYGYAKPEGYLPVDVYKINLDGTYDTSEIIYPFGWRVKLPDLPIMKPEYKPKI